MTVSDQDLANAIRFLSIDAVQQANSGHPGMPMGMADIATVLFREFLKVNPRNANWFNRDRFILSNGHGSMLQYAALHLAGFDLSLDEIKQFRQLHSQTPGHPEVGDTAGVETTTGPLGQGIANAVGMALAEKMLAAQFNREGHEIVDHRTFVFAGDGCLMEGVSHEASSLAGTWGLDKLTVIYDDNGISIDGEVQGWFTTDTAQRFRAYGWHVIEAVDGHNPEAIRQAMQSAVAHTDQPTLICCRTQIGWGSPSKVGTAGVHGAPLGEDEIQATRERCGWNYDRFEIPDAIYQAWDLRPQGQAKEDEWNLSFAKYERAHPDLAAEFLRRMHGDLPTDFSDQAKAFIAQTQQQQQPQATRKASLAAINFYANIVDELVGGSADLSGSNCTEWKAVETLSQNNFAARYIKYGVREFGMSAIANGMALHGCIVPFVGTFLVFADYARNAMRLSALMQQKVIYVLTHDSIGLGEDGPTHQPIEHAAMLRMTPNMQVWRPADSAETAVSWAEALQYQGPSALLLSRQTLPVYHRDQQQLDQISQGGYVLHQEQGDCEAVIIATGSEVALAMTAAEHLTQQGIAVRVVSMPCADVFLAQPKSIQDQVLPPHITARVAVEAGVSDYWYRFVGLQGKVVAVDRFGLSAPIDAVYQECSLTVEVVEQAVRAVCQKVPLS